MLAANEVLVRDTEGYGAECAHRAPVPQVTPRHAWAKTHKMANSAAETATVYNREADIALPITLVRLRQGVDGTKARAIEGQTID
jgi:hypothetical protein